MISELYLNEKEIFGAATPCALTNWSVYHNCLASLLTFRLSNPTPRTSDSLWLSENQSEEFVFFYKYIINSQVVGSFEKM